MNGPVNSMYKLKPIIQFQDPLTLSHSMYHMKKITCNNSSTTREKSTNNLPDVSEQVKQVLKNHSTQIENLKKRQEKVLDQLNGLKQQMLSFNDELSKDNSCKEVKSCQEIISIPTWVGVIEEVVVHANPNTPPYSLLAINHLWPEVLRVRVTCHTHSSVVSLPPNLSEFSVLENTSSPTFNIRLVWKNTVDRDCELVISLLSICKLRGEVNLLRYLHRIICSPSDSMTETKLDSLLDLCHTLAHAYTVRDKQLLLRALNARLGKSTWLTGDKMTIADLAAWSALRNSNGADLSQNMSKWQSRLSSAIGKCKSFTSSYLF